MALLCDLSEGFTSLDHVDIPGAREGTRSRIARLSETNPGRSGRQQHRRLLGLDSGTVNGWIVDRGSSLVLNCLGDWQSICCEESLPMRVQVQKLLENVGFFATR
jgi:hypothetical protein